MALRPIDTLIRRGANVFLSTFKRNLNCDVSVALDTATWKTMAFVAVNVEVDVELKDGTDQHFKFDEVTLHVIMHDVVLTVTGGETDEHPEPIEEHAVIEFPDGDDLRSIIKTPTLTRFIESVVKDMLVRDLGYSIEVGEDIDDVSSFDVGTMFLLDVIGYEMCDEFFDSVWFTSRLRDSLNELAKRFQ